MQIFNYDPATSRYLPTPEPVYADPSPARPGAWLIPAFSTPKEPPTAPAGFAAVFDRQGDAWSVQPLPPAKVTREDAQIAAAGTPEGIARTKRDGLLRASDGIAWGALDRGEPVPATWVAYRQALRNVPQQEGFPDSINWPQAPAV